MASEPKKQRVESVDSEETCCLCSNQSDDSHVSKSSEGSTPSKTNTILSTPETDSDSPKEQSFSDNGQYSNVPHNLSDWKRKHIENLNIKVSYQPEITPLQLINRKIQKTGLQMFEVRRIESDEEERKIASLVKYVKQSKFMEMLAIINYITFDDLSRNSLKGLDMYADDRYQCSFIPDGLPESLKLWFYRFHTHGKMFAHILHKMVENKEEGIQNYECHFQHLFETFAKMFGMFSLVSFAPALQIQKMKIMDTEVISAPDIIFSHHCLKPLMDNEMKNSLVVAVCEVKKERPLLKDRQMSPPSSKLREKSRKRSSTSDVSSSSAACSAAAKKEFPHMSDKLIGQHGGELLFNYQHSNRCDMIIGLVVQETHITFTTLEMTDNQFQGIKDGNISHSKKDRPIFTFTKAYDYLKEEDLENIIEPLIRLGLEQHK